MTDKLSSGGSTKDGTNTKTLREIAIYADLIESAVLSFKDNYDPDAENYVDNIDATLDLLRLTHYVKQLFKLTKKEDSQSS